MGKYKRFCVKCVNFKTVLITKKNIHKFTIAQTFKIYKKLKKQKEVPIFYCKRDLLKSTIYVLTPSIGKFSHQKCLYYNIPPEEFVDPYQFIRHIYKKRIKR